MIQEGEKLWQFQKLSWAISELAIAVGVSERQIWREIKAGRLQTVRIESRVLILDADARAWLEAGREQPPVNETDNLESEAIQ